MATRMQTMTLMLDAQQSKAKTEQKDYLLSPNDLKRKADAGDPSAQFLVALGHGEGRLGFVVNFDESSRYLEMARQSTKSYDVIGGVVEGYHIALSGGNLKDEALPRLVGAMESGFVPGGYAFSVLAYKDLKADEEQGLQIEKKTKDEVVISNMQKATKLGFTPAMEFLGKRYIDGWGVEVNFETAFQYLQSAAEGGDAPARIFLAKAYEKGVPEWGIASNSKESQKWYRLAGEQGILEASTKAKKTGTCVII